MRSLLIKRSLCLALLCISQQIEAAKPKQPRVIVAFIIDQCAYHYFPKLNKHCTGAFRTFLDKGICFDNTHHPHACPSTAPGHATLSTGTVARDHGVVCNSWINQDGKKVVFGKTTQRLPVPTISDSLIEQNSENRAIAISLKARSACALAGSYGIGVWFNQVGQFVSNKYDFNAPPEWIKAINKTVPHQPQTSISWETRYPIDHEAYQLYPPPAQTYFARKSTYDKTHITLYNGLKHITSDDNDCDLDNGTTLFVRTPQANQLLFDAAQTYLEYNYTQQNPGTLLLWISLSTLDKLGHEFGPDSHEVIDLLYHLDLQINNFMNFVNKKCGCKNVLFVLTADHGITPIPEHMNQAGFGLAKRILINPLVRAMNKYIKKKFGISKVVLSCKANQFYLDHKKIPENKYDAITKRLKSLLGQLDGIKHVWTKAELLNKCPQPDSLEQFAYNQCHPANAGDLICIPRPYCMLVKYPTGTVHRSPYDYDTRVPLFFYQKGRKHKHIHDKVWATQLAPTLANVLHIPRPAATTAKALCL